MEMPLLLLELDMLMHNKYYILCFVFQYIHQELCYTKPQMSLIISGFSLIRPQPYRSASLRSGFAPASGKARPRALALARE